MDGFFYGKWGELEKGHSGSVFGWIVWKKRFGTGSHGRGYEETSDKVLTYIENAHRVCVDVIM